MISSRKAVLPPLVLVIRYGFTAEHDAIDELDKVINLKGEAWFGKFGRRIGKATSEILATQEGHRLVVLLRNRSKADNGQPKFKAYKLIQMTEYPPRDRRLYPSYYKSHIDNIGTWIALQKYEGPEIDLSRLHVRRSVHSVLEACSVSMQGFFWCRLR